ncbi:AcfA family outer membrane beta-barrel protein [Vibrio alfacsensis]|uniref:AcfA family outer membrane beta-barrel protein n=1 Tax=Vibrio alfacsensis TaxID=1074311 RepID=UPI002ADD539C|nr:AcfA family outer membrane beta-barrel protein [Vibrio alfacsensis]WQE78141.1 AcfA family outer membrane beta-barrel protein [Vibrio alfacsensis]
MKKTLLTIIAATSFSAAAAPYVGLEYGFGTTDHDFETTFKSDGVNLNPELEDGIFGGFIGYQLNDVWGIELGYSQFDLDDSRSRFESFDPATGIKEEMEWDSSIKAKQITLAPVFNYALNQKWSAKVKAGLTYTQYEAHAGKYLETENERTDHESSVAQGPAIKHDSNELGAMVSVGAEYRIFPQLTIGANAKYQLDSYANTASINLGSTYYF